MSVENNDDTAEPAAVAEAGSVVLVRYRRGLVGESSRTVHVVPLPPSGPALALLASAMTAD